MTASETTGPRRRPRGPALHPARALAGVLLLVVATAARPQAAAPVAGEYFCVTGGTCPCQSDGNLRLAVDGRWYWGSHTGRWQTDATRVTFDGLGGAAALGPASIGAGTLTFNSGGNQVVCWQPRPGVARPGSPD